MVSSTVSVSLIPLSALRSRHLPNGKRYAGQLPAVEPIVGLGDVAGVEQLVDPETGEFDADVVETGQSKSQRDRRNQLVAVIE